MIQELCDTLLQYPTFILFSCIFDETIDAQQEQQEELHQFPTLIEYHLIQYHHSQPFSVKSYSLPLQQADVYHLEQNLHQFYQFMFQNFIAKKKSFLLLSDHETIQYLLHLQHYIKLATHYKRMSTLLDDLFIEAFQNNDQTCVTFLNELQLPSENTNAVEVLLAILQKLLPFLETKWEEEQAHQQYNASSVEHTNYFQIIGATVIRMRGLPWVATVEDILDFFSGFSIATTENQNSSEDASSKYQVLIVLNAQGRSTGEAYIKFTNEEECRRALAEKDCQNMGHRYVELFPSSMEEMEYSRKVMEKQLNINTTVVRMRGIPFHCNDKDIELFFAELPIQKDGIFIFKNGQGRQTGDAYVEFETKEAVVEALKRNKEKIHDRYIELFRSNKEEMYAAQYQQLQQQQQYQNHHYHQQRRSNRNYYKIQSEFCVKLRGLPFDTFEEDIAEFFNGLEIAPQGIHLVLEPSHAHQQESEENTTPKHTGTAFVEFTNEDDFQNALSKHKQMMKNRYIEVFPAKQHQNNQQQQHQNYQPHRHLYPQRSMIPQQPMYYNRNAPIVQPLMLSSPPFVPQMQTMMRNGQHQNGTSLSNEASTTSTNTIKPMMRVKNLPLGVTLEEIGQFFKGFDLIMDSIRFKMDNYGRPMNEITVAFQTVAGSHKAFIECNHKTIRENVVELFFVNQASFQHFQQCYLSK